jgi:hypothetical protein
MAVRCRAVDGMYPGLILVRLIARFGPDASSESPFSL